MKEALSSVRRRSFGDRGPLTPALTTNSASKMPRGWRAAMTSGQRAWDFPTHSFSYCPGREGREPGPSGGGETSLANNSGKKQLLCELQSVPRTHFGWSPGVSQQN